MSELAGRPHILVVEDERHLAEGLKFNLEAEGYRASLAPDGESALALLARAQVAPDANTFDPAVARNPATAFDAVVLDVMLPGSDGFAVVEALRQREDYTPVLILTARGRAEDVLRGFSAGADDYLPKPFDLSILLARLHGLLRRRTWQQPLAAPAPSEAAPAAPSQFSFAGRTIDFDALELRTPALQDAPAGPPAAPGSPPGTHRLPQGTAGAGLARPRRHRHPRDRQLHCPPPPLPRRRPRPSRLPADGPRRRLPLPALIRALLHA
jgi:DNA-binding response OmpR family regulator